MSKVTATNKKSEYKVIFNYKELDEKESLIKANSEGEIAYRWTWSKEFEKMVKK